MSSECQAAIGSASTGVGSGASPQLRQTFMNDIKSKFDNKKILKVIKSKGKGSHYPGGTNRTI